MTATTPARACAACGAPVRPPFRAPPPELAPDLDLRPGEPTRSTLARWVQTCRRCGVTAPDLTSLPAGAAATAASEAYGALRRPGPAMPFLRWAMLAQAAGDQPSAAEATLQAAWALDDAEEDAAPLRRDAAESWGEPADMDSALRLLDVLRRAGEWDAAAARAVLLDGAGLDENSARILAFQRERIAARDTGRHLMSSALRPPARTPHVTHGKRETGGQRETGGFWRKLLGRKPLGR